jgi:hypothetical protein
MTDITARDITRALRTYIPHATLTTTAGPEDGSFTVRLPIAAHHNIAGAHGLAAALGSQLGTEFGVDGERWVRGKHSLDVHIYLRSARMAATAAAERAERDRQRELARPKATIAEALGALDNRPTTGAGTGITEGITLNEKLALGALVATVRELLAPRPQEDMGGHRPASLLTALARVNSAEDADRATMPGGKLSTFIVPSQLAAYRDLANAVREHLAPVPEGTMRPWSVTGFIDEQDTVHATGVLAGNHDMTSASDALRGTGAWFLVVPAASPEQALEVACQAHVDALAASADDYPDAAELGELPCEAEDHGMRSVGCSEYGVRVCGTHALADARRGNRTTWDEDAPQWLMDQCERLASQAS